MSADTARRQASEYQWEAKAELFLYVIHGTLHLVGHDDQEPGKRKVMRDKEELYLRASGINPPRLARPTP